MESSHSPNKNFFISNCVCATSLSDFGLLPLITGRVKSSSVILPDCKASFMYCMNHVIFDGFSLRDMIACNFAGELHTLFWPERLSHQITILSASFTEKSLFLIVRHMSTALGFFKMFWPRTCFSQNAAICLAPYCLTLPFARASSSSLRSLKPEMVYTNCLVVKTTAPAMSWKSPLRELASAHLRSSFFFLTMIAGQLSSTRNHFFITDSG